MWILLCLLNKLTFKGFAKIFAVLINCSIFYITETIILFFIEKVIWAFAMRLLLLLNCLFHINFSAI